MKKILIMASAAALALCLAGCSGTTAQDGGGASTPSESQSSEPSKDTIKVEQLEWSAEMGAEGGARHGMFQYTNNSSETIVDFRLEMTMKEDVEDAQIEEVCGNLLEQDVTIEELRDGMMVCRGTFKTEPGETSQPDALNYGGWYVLDMGQYDLMEPRLLTIKFLHDGNIYTEYYDFDSGEYTLDTDVVNASQWADSELASIIPQPENAIIESLNDWSNQFSFTAICVTQEGFDAYVEACEEKGFTVNVTSGDSFYYADNEDGVHHVDILWDSLGNLTCYSRLIDVEG